eukprot:9495043-Pyramimonas_sp.AAC.1
MREHIASRDTDVALDMLPHCRLHPGFWKSTALAENLEAAALGRAPEGSGLSALLSAALPAARAALPPAPGQRPRPQRAAHLALRLLACTARPLHALVRRRLVKFAGRSRGRLDSIDWDNCAMVLARCPCSWAWAVLRTWCGGWMTSARIISPLGQRQCAFGCVQRIDSIRHYSRCPPMHRALR